MRASISRASSSSDLPDLLVTSNASRSEVRRVDSRGLTLRIRLAQKRGERGAASHPLPSLLSEAPAAARDPLRRPAGAGAPRPMSEDTR